MKHQTRVAIFWVVVVLLFGVFPTAQLYFGWWVPPKDVAMAAPLPPTQLQWGHVDRSFTPPAPELHENGVEYRVPIDIDRQVLKIYLENICYWWFNGPTGSAVVRCPLESELR